MSSQKASYEAMGPFVMIPHSFINNSRNLSFHARWLYVALLYYRNGESKMAFPSYETMHKLTRLRRNKISDGIKELEREGWMKRKKRFGSSTLYTLFFSITEQLDEDGRDGPNNGTDESTEGSIESEFGFEMEGETAT
jgi:hypothetical protein